MSLFSRIFSSSKGTLEKPSTYNSDYNQNNSSPDGPAASTTSSQPNPSSGSGNGYMAGASPSNFTKLDKKLNGVEKEEERQFYKVHASNVKVMYEKCFPIPKWCEGKEVEGETSSLEPLLAFTASATTGPKQVRVKLLLTGNVGFFMKQMARIARSEFNALHAALQIGDVIVDWNTSEICLPRTVKSSAALVAIDLGLLTISQDSPEIKSLCQVMVNWNLNKNYDMKDANCQQFVEEAIVALGKGEDFQKLKSMKSGAIGKFLDSVKKGKFDLECPELRTIDKGSPVTCFTSHHQLDAYVRTLFKSFSSKEDVDEGSQNFFNKHPDVWTLLKAFDRAFWIRVFTSKDGNVDDEVRPLCPNDSGPIECTKCPFPFTKATMPSGCSIRFE